MLAIKVRTMPITTVFIVVVFFNQLTGVLPIKISRSVPPPTDPTNAIIIIPKISKRLRIAEEVADIAKANVLKMIIISMKVKFMLRP